MRFPALVESFRARLLLLLALMLGLTLGIQYYFNLRAVKTNARMIIEQEQAIMTGIGVGLKSLTTARYLDEIIGDLREPLLNSKRVRVRNIMVVDDVGNIRDSLEPEYIPQKNEDESTRYVNFKEIRSFRFAIWFRPAVKVNHHWPSGFQLRTPSASAKP